jgi:lipoprotein-releasing system ATP-binding protein
MARKDTASTEVPEQGETPVLAPLLRTKGITRSFSKPSTGASPARQIEVLKGIDLEVKRGEMISIVGQSGVGKSTLLQILGTLDQPTAGTVHYGGVDVFALPSKALAAFRNRHIGFVFQFHHLMAEFTALENVMLPTMIAREPRGVARDRAAQLLESVGLAHRLEHKPGELSGGELQRVAIARALVMEPDIVFADEPTGNLDTSTSEDIHQLLVELNQRTETAFVVVTHNVRLAWRMKRHLLLQHGVVRALSDDEAPEEFLPKTKASN